MSRTSLDVFSFRCEQVWTSSVLVIISVRWKWWQSQDSRRSKPEIMYLDTWWTQNRPETKPQRPPAQCWVPPYHRPIWPAGPTKGPFFQRGTSPSPDPNGILGWSEHKNAWHYNFHLKSIICISNPYSQNPPTILNNWCSIKQRSQWFGTCQSAAFARIWQSLSRKAVRPTWWERFRSWRTGAVHFMWQSCVYWAKQPDRLSRHEPGVSLAYGGAMITDMSVFMSHSHRGSLYRFWPCTLTCQYSQSLTPGKHRVS